MRVRPSYSGFAIALIAAPVHCWACVIIYPSIRVGPDFQVKVEDRGRPVRGLRVEIDHLRAFTDRDGLAHFRKIAPGSYSLRVDHDAGIPAGADLQVSLDGPASVTVPLHWPSVAPVLARSMKGVLHAADYFAGPTAPPPPSASLDLLEGLSGRVLASGHTTTAGEFSSMGLARACIS